MSAAVVEHRAPARRRRRHTKAEKTHGGLGEDGSGHANGGLHDHRLNDVGQDVADDNTQVAGAEGSRGFNEFALPGSQDLSADQTSVTNPSAEREG